MKTVWKKLNSRPKRAFFFSPETISKVDDIKIKSKVRAFQVSFLYPFIFLSLSSFLYFLPLYKALKFSEIKVQLNSRPKRAGVFFLKVDDIKIKSKVSAFFLPLTVYLPFIPHLSLLFVPLQDLKKA